MNPCRAFLALAAVLAAAATAAADPVLDRVDFAVVKGRRVDVVIESTLQAAGEVAVAGDINGQLVSIRRRLRAGHRKLTLHVDPRKLGLRNVVTALRFTLDAIAR